MINSLLERFNSLTTREKLLCITTLLFIVWSLWDSVVYQAIASRQKKVSAELADINIQLSAQQKAAVDIEALGKIDPNQVNKQKLKKVKAKLNKLKQQMDSGEKKFVPAHLMAKVLQDMLKKNSGLKLVKLETLPVTTLTGSKQEQSWIYRHGLSITLSGSFFNTLNYLKSLESLPWRFNWDKIDYQVKEYPVAETSLQIYTLSFEENWLGL